MFSEQCYCPVAQYPYSYVCKVKASLQQLTECLHRGLLQHFFQYRGRLPVAHEHSVVACHRGIEPQSVAHHIGLGNGGECSFGTDEHVAAHYHGVHIARHRCHQLLIQWQLQVEQGLRQALSALPSEHRHGCEHLSRGCVCRQSSALSAGVQQYAWLLC